MKSGIAGQPGDGENSGLQIRLMGAPQILLNGVPLTGLKSSKAQALLFYLAVTGRGHARPILASPLRGDVSEAAARTSLRKALQQLRQHLGNYLIIDRTTIALAQSMDCWVDVLEFQTTFQDLPTTEEPSRMRRAIDLYRGDFLEGFYVRDAPDFEAWWLSERARLRELVLHHLDEFANHYAKQDDLESAIALTRRFLAIEPWREGAHRKLMSWLVQDGQRSAALAQYEICRQALAEELAVEPARETTALYKRIRNGDLREPMIPRPRPFTSKPPAFLEADHKIVEPIKEHFVGRERQLSQLEAFLEAAKSGQGRVAFVSGEAGWGKTRLLDQFSHHAQERFPDLIVASGVCTTYAGTGDPYLPFREILRMASGDVEQMWAVGAITRQHALKIWDLLPTMINALGLHGRNLIDTFVSGEALLSRAIAHSSINLEEVAWIQDLIKRVQNPYQITHLDQRRIFEEYTAVLRALTKNRPVLLILDDLHWADSSSISLLYHLARRLTGNKILIIGAYRPEDVALGRERREHPLMGVLNEFKRLLGDVWVKLDHDGEEEILTFVDSLLDKEPNQLSETFRGHLAANTKGHPLFTVEILRDMQERGYLVHNPNGDWIESPTLTWGTLPRRVEGVIEKRIDGLDPKLRELLVTASVEGEEFTAGVLAQVRTIDEGEVVGYLSGDLAKKHRLVRASSIQQIDAKRVSRYQFRHNLFQKFLYSTLDPVERAYLHEAIGNALESLYQGQTEEIAVQLARHFQNANAYNKAIRYLRQAGDTAARLYAHIEAIGHYHQAIQLANQTILSSEDLTTLYTRLGRSFELNSQFEQALATYDDMESLAHQHNDSAMELASLAARATIQGVPTYVHDPIRAREMGEQALRLAGEIGDQTAEAKILCSLSLANYFSNRLTEAIESGERSLALARELDLREQIAQTLNDLGGLVYLYSGRIPLAKKALREASVLWRELGNTPMLADSLGGCCVAHVYTGDYDKALAFSEEAYQLSHSIDNIWGQSYSKWAIGEAFADLGEYSKAIATMEECIRLGELAGFIAAQTQTRIKLATVYMELGALDRAWELVQLAVDMSRAKILSHNVLGFGILARLQILSGDLANAQDTIDSGKKDPYRESWAVFYLPVLVADLELAMRRGNYERALEISNDFLSRIRAYDMRSGLPDALYLQGKAYLSLDQHELARNCFLEARAAAEETDSQRTMWRILSALTELEADPEIAAQLHQETRQVLEYILTHIEDKHADLRESFLEQAEVQAILDK
jgi:predicted ATPase/DNA-binding SARP family transcriptional activator